MAKTIEIEVAVRFDIGPKPAFAELVKEGGPLAWIPPGFVFREVRQSGHGSDDTILTYRFTPAE